MSKNIAWLVVLLIDLMLIFWAPAAIILSKSVNWRGKLKWLLYYIISALIAPLAVTSLTKILGRALKNPMLPFWGAQSSFIVIVATGIVVFLLFKKKQKTFS